MATCDAIGPCTMTCSSTTSDGALCQLYANPLFYRRQFHDQHQLAELWRRVHDVVPLPDGRSDDSQLRLRRRRYRVFFVCASRIKSLANKENCTSELC